jgi:hypothetical protein
MSDPITGLAVRKNCGLALESLVLKLNRLGTKLCIAESIFAMDNKFRVDVH